MEDKYEKAYIDWVLEETGRNYKMRFRVVRVWYDDGAFGYTAPPIEEVVKDWLTRAEAKSIYRHLRAKHWYDEFVSVEVECMFDGDWQNCSQGWIYTAIAEQEEWFDRKGLDYNWWLYSGKVERLQ